MQRIVGGFLITFEGIGGSGKSTLARLLREHLSHVGWDVRASREPGATKLAEVAQHGIRPGATRQSLRRLAARGHIDRLANGHRGRYMVRDRLFRRFLELQRSDS